MRQSPSNDPSREQILLVSRSSVALVLHRRTEDSSREDTSGGRSVFESFLLQNSTCFWNACLVRGVSGLEYGGCLPPATLLLSGNHFALEVVRSAWARRVLRPPKGYVIAKLGDVASPLWMRPVLQTQFAPLSEALCVCVAELNGERSPATADRIRERLRLGFPEVQSPRQDVLHAALGTLIRERKIYHTGNGYFIVGPDTYRQRAASPPCERQMLMTNEEAIVRLHGGRENDSSIQVDEMDIAAAMDTTTWTASRSTQVPSSPELQQFVGGSRSLKVLRFKGPKSKGTMERPPFKDSNIEELAGNVHKGERHHQQSVLAKILKRMQFLTDSKSSARHVVFSAQFPPLDWLDNGLLRCHSVATQTTINHESPMSATHKTGSKPSSTTFKHSEPATTGYRTTREEPHRNSGDKLGPRGDDKYRTLPLTRKDSAAVGLPSLSTRQRQRYRSPSHRYSGGIHYGTMTHHYSNHYSKRHGRRSSSRSNGSKSSDSPKTQNIHSNRSRSSRSAVHNNSSNGSRSSSGGKDNYGTSSIGSAATDVLSLPTTEEASRSFSKKSDRKEKRAIDSSYPKTQLTSGNWDRSLVRRTKESEQNNVSTCLNQTTKVDNNEVPDVPQKNTKNSVSTLLQSKLDNNGFEPSKDVEENSVSRLLRSTARKVDNNSLGQSKDVKNSISTFLNSKVENNSFDPPKDAKNNTSAFLRPKVDNNSFDPLKDVAEGSISAFLRPTIKKVDNNTLDPQPNDSKNSFSRLLPSKTGDTTHNQKDESVLDDSSCCSNSEKSVSCNNISNKNVAEPSERVFIKPLVLKNLVDIPKPSAKASDEILLDNSVSVEVALDPKIKSPQKNQQDSVLSTTVVTEETVTKTSKGRSKVVTVTSITTSLSSGSPSSDKGIVDPESTETGDPLLGDEEGSSTVVNDLNIETEKKKGTSGRIIDCSSSCNIVTQVK